MNDECVYEIQCEICEVNTVITIEEIDEKPAFCPMCGEQLEN